MPEPKFVVAVGTCACSGVFSMAAIRQGGIDAVIPVSAYIPGCPRGRGDYRRRGQTADQSSGPQAAPAAITQEEQPPQ